MLETNERGNRSEGETINDVEHGFLKQSCDMNRLGGQ